MALQSPEPVKTFSIGFEESSFNELEYARLVAGQYRTQHHETVVRAEFDRVGGETGGPPRRALRGLLGDSDLHRVGVCRAGT